MIIKRIFRRPVSRLKKELRDFKRSMHDWVLLLRHDQRDLKIKVVEVEQRLRKLENNELIKIV